MKKLRGQTHCQARPTHSERSKSNCSKHSNHLRDVKGAQIFNDFLAMDAHLLKNLPFHKKQETVKAKDNHLFNSKIREDEIPIDSDPNAKSNDCYDNNIPQNNSFLNLRHCPSVTSSSLIWKNSANQLEVDLDFHTDNHWADDVKSFNLDLRDPQETENRNRSKKARAHDKKRKLTNLENATSRTQNILLMSSHSQWSPRQEKESFASSNRSFQYTKAKKLEAFSQDSVVSKAREWCGRKQELTASHPNDLKLSSKVLSLDDRGHHSESLSIRVSHSKRQSVKLRSLCRPSRRFHVPNLLRDKRHARSSSLSCHPTSSFQFSEITSKLKSSFNLSNGGGGGGGGSNSSSVTIATDTGSEISRCPLVGFQSMKDATLPTHSSNVTGNEGPIESSLLLILASSQQIMIQRDPFLSHLLEVPMPDLQTPTLNVVPPIPTQKAEACTSNRQQQQQQPLPPNWEKLLQAPTEVEHDKVVDRRLSASSLKDSHYSAFYYHTTINQSQVAKKSIVKDVSSFHESLDPAEIMNANLEGSTLQSSHFFSSDHVMKNLLPDRLGHCEEFSKLAQARATVESWLEDCAMRRAKNNETHFLLSEPKWSHHVTHQPHQVESTTTTTTTQGIIEKASESASSSASIEFQLAIKSPCPFIASTHEEQLLFTNRLPRRIRQPPPPLVIETEDLPQLVLSKPRNGMSSSRNVLDANSRVLETTGHHEVDDLVTMDCISAKVISPTTIISPTKSPTPITQDDVSDKSTLVAGHRTDLFLLEILSSDDSSTNAILIGEVVVCDDDSEIGRARPIRLFVYPFDFMRRRHIGMTYLLLSALCFFTLLSISYDFYLTVLSFTASSQATKEKYLKLDSYMFQRRKAISNDELATEKMASSDYYKKRDLQARIPHHVWTTYYSLRGTATISNLLAQYFTQFVESLVQMSIAWIQHSPGKAIFYFLLLMMSFVNCAVLRRQSSLLFDEKICLDKGAEEVCAFIAKRLCRAVLICYSFWNSFYKSIKEMARWKLLRCRQWKLRIQRQIKNISATLNLQYLNSLKDAFSNIHKLANQFS